MDVFRYAYTSSALQTHFVLRFDFEILSRELGLYFYPVGKCHKKQVRLFWFNEQAISVFSRLGKPNPEPAYDSEASSEFDILDEPTNLISLKNCPL